MSEPKIRFVVASRQSRDNFFKNTATGRFISLYKFPFIELDLYDSNTDGLPTVYNKSIEKSKDHPAILIFAHDDIHISDFFWVDQLVASLNYFDIVGVAGNKRRSHNQPSWAFVDKNFTWDRPEFLSGVVGHGNGFPPRTLSVFGPPCQEVKLLDGLFLACSSEFLQHKNLRFDELFDFHFYDLDFCRQAELAGARMGTWCISIIHESAGGFGSPKWRSAMDKYFLKWGE